MRYGCAGPTAALALLIFQLPPACATPIDILDRCATPRQTLSQQAMAQAFVHSFSQWKNAPKTPLEQERERLGWPNCRTREEYCRRFFAGDRSEPTKPPHPMAGFHVKEEPQPKRRFPGYLAALQAERGWLAYTNQIASFRHMLALVRSRQGNGIVSQKHVAQAEEYLQERLDDADTFVPNMDALLAELHVCGPLRLDEELVRPIDCWIQQFDRASADYRSAIHVSRTSFRPGRADKLRGQLENLLISADLVRNLPFQAEVKVYLKKWHEISSADLKTRLRSLQEEKEKLIDDIEEEGKWIGASKRLDMVKREISWGEFESSLRAFEARDWRQLPQRRQGLAEFESFINVHGSVRNLLSAAYHERLELFSAAQPSLPPVLIENIDVVRATNEAAMEAATRAALKGISAVQAAQDDASRQVRQDLRDLRIAEYNYRRVQVRATVLGYAIADASLVILEEGIDNSRTKLPIADLIMQLSNAHRAFQAFRQDLYDVWLQFHAARINLYCDIGVMPSEFDGTWQK